MLFIIETHSKIIKFVTRIFINQDFKTIFRDYQHIKINVHFLSNEKDHKIYLNLECSITLKDRVLFIKILDF